MARSDADVSVLRRRSPYYDHAAACLHQWGDWARRPQFWEDLRVSGMYALLPIPRDSRAPHAGELDQQSVRIHAAVMAMDDDLSQGVLYAYYVRNINFYAKPHVFRQYGIGRTRFYDLLKAGTLAAFNASRRF